MFDYAYDALRQFIWEFVLQLYSLNERGLTQLSRENFTLEKDIQHLVEGNLQEIFNLQFVATELPINEFRLDTLAFDEDTNAFVIIEYKRGHSYSVIDQGYSYLSVMLNNKAEFILEYNERMNETLKRDEVDWSASKVIFVAPSFNAYQKNSVNFKDLPFELWEIKRFESGVIAFDQHNSHSNEKIETLNANTFGAQAQTVLKEIKSYSEVDHTRGISEDTLQIWTRLKEELLEWSDVNCSAMKNYVGFKRGNSLFAAVRLFKNHLIIDFRRGYLSAQGDKSRNFFTLDDPKNLVTERTWNSKNGRTGIAYILKLSKTSELEYAKFLLKQKYELL